MPDWQAIWESVAWVLSERPGEAPIADYDVLLVAIAVLLTVWLVVVVASRRAKWRREARTVKHLSRDRAIQVLREK